MNNTNMKDYEIILDSGKSFIVRRVRLTYDENVFGPTVVLKDKYGDIVGIFDEAKLGGWFEVDRK